MTTIPDVFTLALLTRYLRRRRSLLADRMLSFLGLGLVLYAIASTYGLVTHDSIITHTTKCGYCRKSVSVKVRLSSFSGGDARRLTRWRAGEAVLPVHELARRARGEGDERAAGLVISLRDAGRCLAKSERVCMRLI
jgi:hypothetical protein